GEAVPDARARFTRYIRPILAEARDVAPHCYYVLWGPADSPRIGPWALRMLQMSTVDPQLHADSAHVVADCFLYMNVDDDDYRNEYILNAVRASGFHRALIARLPASEGTVHVAYTRMLCVMITNGYLHSCNEKRWSYAQIAEDLGGVCLERLLLQCLQYTSGDPDHWGDSVQCLYTIMYMASDFSLASPYSSGSRPRLFANPDGRTMLRRDCHRASPCADRRCSYYRSGLFDVVLQRMGTLRWALYNEGCLFVLEILFATCPESRQAVFDAVCAKAGGDMNYFYMNYFKFVTNLTMIRLGLCRISFQIHAHKVTRAGCPWRVRDRMFIGKTNGTSCRKIQSMHLIQLQSSMCDAMRKAEHEH
ncbi:MAG: hypothetical protein ACPIOQ_06515, partial [Promethearchaeia archaeon]